MAKCYTYTGTSSIVVPDIRNQVGKNIVYSDGRTWHPERCSNVGLKDSSYIHSSKASWKEQLNIS
jgi:hypothetical protein